MNRRPDYTVYESIHAEGHDGRKLWRCVKVGAAWDHDEGDNIHVVLNVKLLEGKRLTLRPREEGAQ